MTPSADDPWAGVTAAVLAGGLGTRLKAAVPDTPKVLAPVNGRPFVTHLLDQLAAAGLRHAVLLTGVGADRVRAALGDQYGQVRLTYSAEPEPLGTGGAVRLALPLFAGSSAVLLLNGDSYCDLDLPALVAFHRGHAAGVSMALAAVADASRFGRVDADINGTVTGFREKDPTPTPGRINAGVYLFDRALLDAVPAGRAVSLERDVLPGWVAAGGARAFPAGGRFLDIGVPADYAAAGAFFARG